jgi:hypothetical protein
MKRRLLRALAVVTAPALGIVLMAGPASAGQRCNYTSEYNACLTITRISTGQYKVLIGIDFHRYTQSEAQAIIRADPSRKFFYSLLYGADAVQDNIIAIMSTTRVGSSEAGLSAEFERVVSASDLNEDPLPGAFDEVYGEIHFTEPRTGAIRTFKTPEIAGLF